MYHPHQVCCCDTSGVDQVQALSDGGSGATQHAFSGFSAQASSICTCNSLAKPQQQCMVEHPWAPAATVTQGVGLL